MHQNLAIELKESSEGLQTKWKGLKDCYKKYRKAEKLTGEKSKNCTTYHRWCWAEPLQFLESCQWNKPPRPKISETSVLVNTVESDLPSAFLQLVSNTSNTSNPTPLKTEVIYMQSSEAMQEDTEPRPDTFIQPTLDEESACLSEPSCKRRWKRSYSTSADDGDTGRVHFKHVRRGKTPGAIDLLFKSYTETFKTLSPKKQALIKVKLAKLFAGAEMDESEVPSLTDSASSEADEHDHVLGSDLQLMMMHLPDRIQYNR